MADTPTGYKCPKCGQGDEFYASSVVLVGRTRITEDGWDYWNFQNDVEPCDHAFLECPECGFSSNHWAFGGSR